MRIEAISPANLRRAVFCATGEAGDQMLARQESWLKSGLLRGQVAWAEDGAPVGFILYYPIETAPLEVTGEGFYAIQCLFVNPERSGRGTGTALVEAAAADAREQGASGLAIEGFSFPSDESGFEFMPKGFFTQIGFEEVASQGPGSLLFRALKEGATPPSYPRTRFQPPKGEGRLRIDLLNCDRCHVGVANCEIVRQAARPYGDRVEVHEHDLNTRDAVLEKGMAFGIFLDGELAFFGPPITEEQAEEELKRRVAERGG